MNDGGTGPLPFRVSDFLSGSYYAVSIVVVLLGLVSFTLSMKWRIDGLEEQDREHPTRNELATVAIKVEDRLNAVERRMGDLDVHGTRALSDRTGLLEQDNHTQAERVQEIIRRLNELQSSMNKIQSDLGVITDRQNNNTNAIKDLQQRIWSSGGERGPTAPINQPQYSPPRPH